MIYCLWKGHLIQLSQRVCEPVNPSHVYLQQWIAIFCGHKSQIIVV